MTRHAEMERPEWAVEQVECIECIRADRLRWETKPRRHSAFGPSGAEVMAAAISEASPIGRHRRLHYSQFRERDIFDPAHEPRHVIRKHRAEGAA